MQYLSKTFDGRTHFQRTRDALITSRASNGAELFALIAFTIAVAFAAGELLGAL